MEETFRYTKKQSILDYIKKIEIHDKILLRITSSQKMCQEFLSEKTYIIHNDFMIIWASQWRRRLVFQEVKKISSS
jgi:hypothetical protein